MLNRFQFARLRGFRRGKKNESSDHRATEADERRGGARTGGSDPRPQGRTGGAEVRDTWQDDDRVARLLARRAAAQEAERAAALERLQGRGGAGVAAPERPAESPSRGRPGQPEPTPVDVAPAAPDTRRGAARTTTVPALDPPAAPAQSAPETRTGGLKSYDIPRGAPTGSARVVCVASGKGGTGKSVVATNLALLRAKMGERVLLVDFDAGLANDHLLLGLKPPYDVGHVMTGEVQARDALVEGPLGIKLLAGGVGRQVMIDPTRRELDRLFKALAPLESDFDLILIDHGAGLSYSTVAHLAATSTLILVTNHEVTALSDGYALYKRAHMVNHAIRIGLVVNRVPDEVMAQGAWERFRGASHKFLGHTPEFIGWVPVDPAIPQAVQMRKPATLSFPDSVAVKALERIAAWPPIDHARSATAFYDRARRALR